MGINHLIIHNRSYPLCIYGSFVLSALIFLSHCVLEARRTNSRNALGSGSLTSIPILFLHKHIFSTLALMCRRRFAIIFVLSECLSFSFKFFSLLSQCILQPRIPSSRMSKGNHHSFYQKWSLKLEIKCIQWSNVYFKCTAALSLLAARLCFSRENFNAKIVSFITRI